MAHAIRARAVLSSIESGTASPGLRTGGRMKRRTFLCLLCVVCCVASASYAKVLTAKAAAGETIQGTVVGIGGRMAGRTRPFTLHGNRYTSADDLANLDSALRCGGP